MSLGHQTPWLPFKHFLGFRLVVSGNRVDYLHVDKRFESPGDRIAHAGYLPHDNTKCASLQSRRSSITTMRKSFPTGNPTITTTITTKAIANLRAQVIRASLECPQEDPMRAAVQGIIIEAIVEYRGRIPNR